MTHQHQLHLGILIYGCGHHQAAWQLPNSSIERIGDIQYYQELAQLSEKGLLDVVFSQIISLLSLAILLCQVFGLIH